MSDINDLYQAMIIDHARSPKNFGLLLEKSHHACGHNPLCGDRIELDVLIKESMINAIAFNGDGCAISKASASLMTETIKGKSVDDAEKLFNSFHRMLTTEEDGDDLGKLMVLKGVRNFPIRVKCATLAWHTLHAALKKQAEVTTE